MKLKDRVERLEKLLCYEFPMEQSISARHIRFKQYAKGSSYFRIIELHELLELILNHLELELEQTPPQKNILQKRALKKGEE